MAGNPHPVFQDGVAVQKGNARTYLPLRLGNPDALRALDGSTFWLCYIQTQLSFFYRDTSDTTSADNGTSVIVDGNGGIWKVISSGAGIAINAAGPVADRGDFDSEDPGFTYFGTDTELLYIRLTGGGWSDGSTITGADGDPGADGATWLSGSTDPSSGSGSNGDFYFQTGTGSTGVAGDTWKKESGTWSKQINLKGPAGNDSTVPGPSGTNGTNGASSLTVVRLVAASNVAISSGLENGDTVDGVTLVTGDFVLLSGQSTAAENGVYQVVASGSASRATAFNTYDSMPGCYFSVMEGTAGADKLYRCTSNKGGTLGTTALAFSEFTSGGGIESIVEGDNITIDATDPQNPVISATGGGGGGNVPSGGTAGQVLSKVDGTDYNTAWVDQTGGASLWFNVKDYGAVGDGSTDDHDAIQDAVDAVIAAGGGTLVFPASSGEYISTSAIQIDVSSITDRFEGAIRLMGDGPAKSCIKCETANTICVQYIGSLTHDESYFRIENMRLTGNASGPAADSIGLSLSAGAWMTYDRLYIEGFDIGVGAVDVDQIAWYNCNIRINNKGMNILAASSVTSANSWTFVNCLIAGNYKFGILATNPNSFNFYGGSVQGNGRVGVLDGTQFGIELSECGNGYGTVLFAGTAFESNGGLGDVVSIQSTNPATISFEGVSFLRSVPAVTLVTGAANNGSGKIRLATSSTALYTTGQKLYVGGVGGVTNANGEWTVTVIDGTHIDLDGSTFAGTYTSGGIITFYGYAANNINVAGSGSNVFYKLSGCQFRSLSPYVASASRPCIGINNTSAMFVDDGSNYYQNSSEAPSFPDSQLISLGARNGAWKQTTPTVTPSGTAGAFAASCVMRTLQLGKLIHVQMVVSITNKGSAAGFSVPFPATPKQVTALMGAGGNAIPYIWFSFSGGVFKYDATQAPIVQDHYFSGSYEVA